MADYSNSEKSRARALVIGVALLVISVGALYISLKHHDKTTAAFDVLLGVVTVLGLYSATH